MTSKHVKKLNFLLLIIFLFFVNGCEEPSKKQEDVLDELTNTLEEDDLGGKTGHILNYFYDFDSNVDIEFYRFTSSYFTFDYEQYLNLFQEEPSLLTLKSFPEYLVEIAPEDVEYTDRTQIDSLTSMDVIEADHY